ncbi:MAG: ATP-binding protein [Tissierellia bacterium]|nr:ATP-binding protein [Tissierellia bacterium]
MDRVIFQGSVPSDLNVVKDFLSTATNHLQQYIYDENLRFDLNLIINELVVNGVLHGNQGNRNKWVSLDIGLMYDCIEIRVKDEGKGIDYDPQKYCLNEKLCSGRGLILVSALSDKLVFEENEVIVIVNL